MLHESTQNLPTNANTPTQPSNPNLSAQIEAENKVHSFTSDLFGELNVLVLNNSPWFIAKEVTDKLEYPKAHDAIKTLCMDRRKISYTELKALAGVACHATLNLSSFRAGCLIISLADMFNLIDKSTKPEAKVMKDWLNRHVLPSIFEGGSYVMVTHPAAQANQPTAPASETSLILKEMSTMVMNILQTVTESTLRMQESMQNNMKQTMARIENSNQNLQSAFSQTVMGVTTQIQNTIKETSPESKWAYQSRGPLSTTQVARILCTNAVRLNVIMEREGLVTLNPTNHYWLMTNKGYQFAADRSYPDRPKKYVNDIRWDMSLVEYLRFNVAEFNRA